MSDTLSFFGANEPESPVFTLDRPVRDWSYYDFASNREAFAMGQSDARPYIEGGCYWRLRGRTVFKYTLLAFNDPEEAWEQLKAKATEGHGVQVTNYTTPRPEGIPTKPSHAEFWVDGISSMMRKGKPITKLRQVWVEGLETRPLVDPAEAEVIFNAWVEWAKTRHFMVFKGHYQKWLERHFNGETSGTRLLGYYRDGQPLGMFGTETVDGVSVVVVAKHFESLHPNVLWIRGLQDLGEGRVLCGSTADTLKSRMGMNQSESWAFDLSSLKGS